MVGSPWFRGVSGAHSLLGARVHDEPQLAPDAELGPQGRLPWGSPEQDPVAGRIWEHQMRRSWGKPRGHGAVEGEAGYEAGRAVKHGVSATRDRVLLKPQQLAGGNASPRFLQAPRLHITHSPELRSTPPASLGPKQGAAQAEAHPDPGAMF